MVYKIEFWSEKENITSVVDEDVTTSSSSMDDNPRRITRSMTKGKASSSLFCITLVSIS